MVARLTLAGGGGAKPPTTPEDAPLLAFVPLVPRWEDPVSSVPAAVEAPWDEMEGDNGAPPTGGGKLSEAVDSR